MNIVLLSGGSGKRLWPLSNDALSKQFLSLLKNGSGKYESMVQRVIRQLTQAQPEADVFVSSNASQAEILRRQIGSVETILEPFRLDTFPAIALSSAYLHYRKGIDKNEAMVVCPIDTYADVEYFSLLTSVERLVSSGCKNIGLLGVVPLYPSEKYGYILRDGGEVKGFVEKPEAEEAERLISEGALWNGGVFALKIGYVLDYAREYIKFENYDDVYNQYDMLPKISFDYEVVEKEQSIGCVIYDGVWKDLGTWNTLTEEMSDVSVGNNVMISESCENTHVINMLGVPVITHDLKDAVVVVSHDGVLVTSKPGSSSLKPLTERVNLRPMYEQRRWGTYRVLEYKRDGQVSTLVKRIRIDAGQAFSYQYHLNRSEVWIIVSGKGIFTLDGVDSVVSPGSMVAIPNKARHRLLAATDIEFIEVQTGTGGLEEEDIVRLEEGDLLNLLTIPYASDNI